jgi:hypothetical protein
MCNREKIAAGYLVQPKDNIYASPQDENPLEIDQVYVVLENKNGWCTCYYPGAKCTTVLWEGWLEPIGKIEAYYHDTIKELVDVLF